MPASCPAAMPASTWLTEEACTRTSASPSAGLGGGRSSGSSGGESKLLSVNALIPVLHDARGVRPRVHVLAGDQAVAEREYVDAVPLDAATLGVRGRRGPLADHEFVADVAAPAAEAHVGLVGECGVEQLADRLALDANA